MSKSNTTENAVLLKLFNNTSLPWDGATQLTVHLHKGVIDDSSISTTNECDYTNYAAVDVDRNSGGWTVSGDTAQNTSAIVFPQCGASGNTISYVSITPKGSTTILYWGQLNDPLTVSNLIQPQFQAGALQITED